MQTKGAHKIKLQRTTEGILFIQLQHQKFNALIDTGATEAYIGYTVYNYLMKQGIAINGNHSMKVRMANGSISHTKGTLVCNTKIGMEQSMVTRNVVLDLAYDVMIGLNLLNNFQASFDFRSGKCL